MREHRPLVLPTGLYNVGFGIGGEGVPAGPQCTRAISAAQREGSSAPFAGYVAN